jgi:drug/metabolite transporter (DMT)-like permease
MIENKKQALGVFQKIISTALYGTFGIWSVLMAGTFSAFNQAWIRAIIAVILLFITNIWLRIFQKISKKDWMWFIIIALAGAASQAPYYYAFQHLGVGTGTVIFSVTTIFGAYLIGKLFFGEKFNRIKIISLFIVLAGVIIIYHFSLTAEQIWPAILMLIAGFLGALHTVLPKKLTSNYSPFLIMIVTFILMFVSNLIISVALGENLPQITGLGVGWVAMICYVVFNIGAMLFSILSFRHLDASVGGLIGLLKNVFAIIFGIIFLGEQMRWPVLAGSVIILAALSLTAFETMFRKNRQSRSDQKRPWLRSAVKT